MLYPNFKHISISYLKVLFQMKTRDKIEAYGKCDEYIFTVSVIEAQGKRVPLHSL